MARRAVGRSLGEIFPALRGIGDLRFEAWSAQALEDLDVVFFATPHGVAAGAASEVLAAGCKLIDLSADYRLEDLAAYERWYGQPHASPSTLPCSAYGLPELFGASIEGKQIIGNPGCYPTSVQLGLAPLLSQSLDAFTSHHIIIDAKSGFSGAGRKEDASLLASELMGNFKAYGTGGHRHHPEIVQGLGRVQSLVGACKEPLKVTFVPHLLPLVRGIESSIYVQAEDLSAEAAIAIYEQFYADKPFVDVLPVGTMPEVKSVAGTNKCIIGINKMAGSSVLLVSAVIDNLIKGAAGQAIQNMNILFGLPETTGLVLMPHYP
jgi:N-acetyl-gamma-glutamyl-phosphate reductase